MTKITTDSDALAVLEQVHRVQGYGGDNDFRKAISYLAARLASTSPAPDGWEPTPMLIPEWGPPEPEFRMDAYYYSFHSTGVLAIDLILSAVACAGKAYHQTEDWREACDPYHERLRGDSPIEWIQNAANDAAMIAAPHPVVEKDHE